MDQIIYLDVYFTVNLFMDLAALSLTALVLSESPRFGRILLASLAGSFFSCLAVILSLRGEGLAVYALLSFLPVNWIAFGYRNGRRFFLSCLFSLLAFLFLGGAVDALGYTVSSLGGKARVTAAVLLFVLLLAFGGFFFWERSLHRRLRERTVTLSLVRGNCKQRLCALVDSASFLRDPVSLDPVILVKADSVFQLLSAEEKESLRRGTGEILPVIPIPLRTASGQGVLFAMRPDRVEILRKGPLSFRFREVRALIALDFSDGGYGGCPALLPLSVLE